MDSQLVQGIVRDETGNTVAGINVFLQKVNGEEDRYGEEAKTNARGEFKFERIDPRQHYLMVSPFGATADSPYEPRFYGGASGRAQAKVLNIDAILNLRSLNINLGEKDYNEEYSHPVGVARWETCFECVHSLR
jgi:Carboxypeptidase regulatory-like domain